MIPLFDAIGVGHMYRMPAINMQGKKGEKKAVSRAVKHPLTCPEFIILFCFVSSLGVHMFIVK